MKNGSMTMSASSILWLLPCWIILLSASTLTVQAKTCLMLFQMADNNLDYYLRQDYEELSSSPVVQDPGLRTWVYFDALNQGGDALPNTVDANGDPVTETFTGSRYMTYDSTLAKMKIEQELPTEQNSDQPATIQAFLEYALADCLPNGFDSLMAVFSSHGGGFAGFGGDENVQRHRHLLQTNQNLVAAIRGALEANPTGPQKLEVVGFDACLMQSMGAADDYQEVANYILASEAVEPGHGWAYINLATATSALDLSREIVDKFLTETQGGASHQSPKTLSIVDTAKYLTFVDQLEAFAGVLLNLLEGGDRSLHAYVSRSRGSSVAFEGVADAVGTDKPSALDIGSWLEKIHNLCDPDPTGPLGAALQSATTAYKDMLVEQGVGPGTAAGTGMHMDWPIQSEYQDDQGLWDQILFENDAYSTALAPKLQAFLKWFLQSSVPDGVSRDSVCRENAELDDNIVVPAEQTSLFQNDSGTVDAEGGMFHLTATISLDASEISVQYGINLTTPLKDELVEQGFTPTSDEYLFLLGGDVAGGYQKNTFNASWDTNFYFLNITGANAYEALYVKDQGDGSKTVPVMFFPQEKKKDLASLQFLDYLFFDFDHWIEQGAQYGFLKFSVDEAIGRVNDNLALFVSNKAGVFNEYPRSGRGLLLPLIELNALVQGRNLTTLPGGFNQTIIEWSEKLNYNILTTPVRNIFKQVPSADAVVVTMTAFKYGDAESLPEKKFYNISAAVAETIATNIATNPPVPTTVPTAANATNPIEPSTTNATSPSVAPASAENGATASPHANASNIFNNGKDDLATDDSDPMQTNQTGNISVSMTTSEPTEPADTATTTSISPSTLRPTSSSTSSNSTSKPTTAPLMVASDGMAWQRPTMLLWLLLPLLLCV